MAPVVITDNVAVAAVALYVVVLWSPVWWPLAQDVYEQWVRRRGTRKSHSAPLFWSDEE